MKNQVIAGMETRPCVGGYIVPDTTLFDSDLAELEYVREKERRSDEH